MEYIIVDEETGEIVGRFNSLSSAKEFIKDIPDFIIYVRKGNT